MVKVSDMFLPTYSQIPESVSLVRLVMVSAPWRRKVPLLENDPPVKSSAAPFILKVPFVIVKAPFMSAAPERLHTPPTPLNVILLNAPPPEVIVLVEVAVNVMVPSVSVCVALFVQDPETVRFTEEAVKCPPFRIVTSPTLNPVTEDDRRVVTPEATERPVLSMISSPLFVPCACVS